MPGVRQRREISGDVESVVPLTETVVKESQIHGRGLFAREPIAKGEIVAIKGGYIFDAATLRGVEQSLGPAQITIAEGFFIGPRAASEREGGMIFGSPLVRPEHRGSGTNCLRGDARHPTWRGAHPRLGDDGRRLIRDAMPLRGPELPRDHHGPGLAASGASAEVSGVRHLVPSTED